MLFKTCRLLKSIFSLTRLNYSTNLAKFPEAERLELLRAMALKKSRENPIILKLDSPEFHSIFTEELKKLVELFKKHNFEIRVAGGAVRDLLMGLTPKDLDFATTATPTEMKDMFGKEQVRMINANGEKHGTITPRINDKENFEVTTLRIDVVTDGRHAEVQFTTDWILDALRRDLTINSMFLGLDGTVYDYFFGYDDLKERRVKFVGDAETRIQEDFLRILRYFRFYGRISEEPNNHEEATLKAIILNKDGLDGISGERIWVELKKTLEGNFSGPLLIKIIECGLAPHLGLPQSPNLDELKNLWSRSSYLNLHPITLLTSLLSNLDEAVNLNSRLKLSVFERELLYFVVENRLPKPHEKPLRPYQQIVLKSKIKQQDMIKYVLEILKYQNSPLLTEFQQWEIPKFPITGTILKENGVDSGKFMGLVLNELKVYWADHDFNLTAEELIKKIPEVVQLLKERKKRK